MKRLHSPGAFKVALAATRFLGRYSRGLAAIPASALWFTPWPVPLTERARAKQESWLASTEQFRTETGAGTVSGFVAGEGPTVLLVHGWGDRGADLGAFIEPLTAAGYRVVGFDLPAHGGSDRTRTDIPGCAKALAAVGERFGGPHAIVAHSMGASSALWALRDQTVAADKVVLLAPNVDLEHAMEAFELLFEIPPTAVDGLRRRIQRRYGPTIWADLRGDEMVAGLDLPALVVHDRDDPQIDHADAERLVKSWPSASLFSTEGLGHAKLLRDDAVISLVVNFLNDEEYR